MVVRPAPLPVEHRASDLARDVAWSTVPHLIATISWQALDVYVLGHWERKFTRNGAFQLGVVVSCLITLAMSVGVLIGDVAMRSSAARLMGRRRIVAGLVTGALAWGILISRALEPVIDALARTLHSDSMWLVATVVACDAALARVVVVVAAGRLTRGRA